MLVKCTKERCQQCIYVYQSENSKSQCCNYMCITGKSRIFEGGKMKHDPKYCTKYKKNKQKGETDEIRSSRAKTF